MTLTKQEAKENLQKLIEKFDGELSAGNIDDYNEEATKTGFIQPFLKDVLGWDVSSRDEVSPEERVTKGKVDYGLKIDGKIKVFIEAKPFREPLDKHINQIIRYGYSNNKVPFILLTNFKQFKLFDVTLKPDKRNPNKGLKTDLSLTQYQEHFDKLWILSRDSVLSGKLDKLLLEKPAKGEPTLVKSILDDLKGWREKLAKDIYKNNPVLFHSEDSERDANYLKEITQRILDRIIFMRFCEGRELMVGQSLKEIFEERRDSEDANAMLFLELMFKQYNETFDSDLFSPQTWEKDLTVNFKALKEIILDTYEPYQFEVIPLEILGNMYEQYLGYTISKLTEHQVKYDLKPELKKGNGIYYTPEYIVDYIVQNTIGILFQELSPSKIEKLRILDPACGSGSFLIKAYDEMLKYYSKRKKARSEEKDKKHNNNLGLQQSNEEPSLTVEEKREILKKHIYGVDIDEQAVEVTKLSLMLKMLDGEYGTVPGRAILPMLDENIICGNSLVSGNILELTKYFGDKWYKVKPFNWDDRFSKIMKEEGGFDVVIGNPPYGAILSDGEIKFIKDTFQTKTKDTAAYFLELAFKLSKNRFSMIVPKAIAFYNAWNSIRKYLLTNANINALLDCGIAFEDANYEEIVLCLQKKTTNKQNTFIYRAEPIKKYTESKRIINDGFVPVSYPKIADVIIFRGLSVEEQNLIDKIKSASIFLGDICSDSFRGLYIPDKDKQTLKKGKWKFINKVPDVKRYRVDKINMIDISHNEKYLLLANKILQPRIFFKVLRGERLVVYPDVNGEFLTTEKLVNFVIKNDSNYHYNALAGIINSKVSSFFLQRILFSRTTETSRVMDISYSKHIPIPKINFSNFQEKKLHDDLVALVNIMLDLNKRVQTEKGAEREQIQRQIDKTDTEIDDLVYGLYDITDAEKKIIEDSLQ